MNSKRGRGRDVFWEKLPTTSKLFKPHLLKDQREILAKSP